MKWTTKSKSKPTERIITRFLLFPRTIDGETRWLEVARIRQEYIAALDVYGNGTNGFEGWLDSEWIDANDKTCE